MSPNTSPGSACCRQLLSLHSEALRRCNVWIGFSLSVRADACQRLSADGRSHTCPAEPDPGTRAVTDLLLSPLESVSGNTPACHNGEM